MAIAETGSFIKAASLIDISTSRVSKSLARLDDRDETQLFNRTRRGISLTETSRAFIEQARRDPR